MSDPLEDWLATALRGDDSPATEAGLRTVESQIGCRLPDAVRFALTRAYRPEGFVGESYIAFFTIDDMLRCWRDAQIEAHGFVPFGSNGGGKWYGLDSRLDAPAFLLMPSTGMDWGTAMFLGATWGEFWETLQRESLFDHGYQPAQK